MPNTFLDVVFVKKKHSNLTFIVNFKLEPNRVMKIKSVSITNLKSFKGQTIIGFDPDFNIIIGPNASGKSNLLDIITVCLHNYFLSDYNLQPENSGKIKIETIAPFQNINYLLEKHLLSSEPSTIEFTFVVKQEDLDNMKVYEELKEAFLWELRTRTSGADSIINAYQEIAWDENTLVENETLSYKIVNNVLQGVNRQLHPLPGGPVPIPISEGVKKYFFLKYLNFIQLFNLLGDRFPGKEIKPPFLFLSPYRGVANEQEFMGSLYNSSSSQRFARLRGNTSKQTTSLINLATIYFAEKKRGFETAAVEKGYAKMWHDDPEVKLVTKYLKRLGYDWSMDLINANQNIYEIRLQKEKLPLSLAQASSGEKEIINYLFGIFALKITNGLIIIDEPELHLHPRWQLLLMELFMELIKKTGNQFIITTHSPVFINVNSVNNLIRIYRSGHESKHVELRNKTGKKLKDLLHLINSTNNEKIFFSDLVILVEGVTDRLVFQKIITLVLAHYKILSVVEVVEINGKGNIKKFREYLKTLEIPYYFIADLDYVNEVGSLAIKDLFNTDLASVDSNSIKSRKSTDGKKLIETLEETIRTKDFTELNAFLHYIKGLRRKLRSNLDERERATLDFFIRAKYLEQEYILTRGDIESYFPEGLSAKDLDNVIELLKEPDFSAWQRTAEYRELENMIVSILKDVGMIAINQPF